MKKKSTSKSPARKKQAKTATAPRAERYILRLFVAGASERSQRAIVRVRDLCDGHLRGCATMEVIDIYQQPGLARTHQIVATPTLVLVFPPPLRRFIGSLTRIRDLFLEMDIGTVSRQYP